MSLGQTFEGLPTWAKGIIAIAGTATTIFVVWKIYNYIQLQMSIGKEKGEIKANEQELKDLEKKGVKPTLNKTQLADMANQIKTAFDGYGTDKSALGRAFAKVKNEADLLNLKTIFGIRTISSGRLNPEPDKTGTLGEIMASELDAASIFDINMVLAKQGIKNRF